MEVGVRVAYRGRGPVLAQPAALWGAQVLVQRWAGARWEARAAGRSCLPRRAEGDALPAVSAAQDDDALARAVEEGRDSVRQGHSAPGRHHANLRWRLPCRVQHGVQLRRVRKLRRTPVVAARREGRPLDVHLSPGPCAYQPGSAASGCRSLHAARGGGTVVSSRHRVPSRGKRCRRLRGLRKRRCSGGGELRRSTGQQQRSCQ
mmetsp:Transcript_10722/g.41644  ORF Transcript_10722/g.41644 Transcript_10722/m.41644 type:complete len:204 (-) Transcript_10722:1437-2048(-)